MPTPTPLYDVTSPPDSEAVKLGAQRIRELKSDLNTTLENIFTGDGNLDGAGTFIPGWLSTTLTADTAGRSNMAAGYILLNMLASGIFTADSPGRAPFAPGFVTNLLLAAGLISADSTGRALMADGYFDDTMRTKFVNGFVTQAMLDSGVQQTKAATSFSTVVSASPQGQILTFASVTPATYSGVIGTGAHGLTIGSVQPVSFAVTGGTDSSTAIGDFTMGTPYFFVATGTTTGIVYATRALAVSGGISGTGITPGTVPANVFMLWVPVPNSSFNLDVTPISFGSSAPTYPVGFRFTFGAAFSSATAYNPVMSVFGGVAWDSTHPATLTNQQAGSIDIVVRNYNTAVFGSNYITGLTLAVF